MRLALALFLVFPMPLWASCQQAFRVGMAAYSYADRTLAQTEETLYRGLGWVTRERVLARLEARSPTTAACHEVARLRTDLMGARQQLERAHSLFTNAITQCDSVNQRRARGNLGVIADTRTRLEDQLDYLASLARRCGDP